MDLNYETSSVLAIKGYVAGVLYPAFWCTVAFVWQRLQVDSLVLQNRAEVLRRISDAPFVTGFILEKDIRNELNNAGLFPSHLPSVKLTNLET